MIGPQWSESCAIAAEWAVSSPDSCAETVTYSTALMAARLKPFPRLSLASLEGRRRRLPSSAAEGPQSVVTWVCHYS